MTLTEHILFHVSCGVVQASCLIIGIDMANNDKMVWAVVAGLVGLAAAHAEHVFSNWV